MFIELKPIYDGHKSFYGKALVTDGKTHWNGGTFLRADGEKHLYSYGAHVAYIDENGVHLLYLWDYSATTLRHIKEFLKQNGFIANSKKQMERDYLNGGRVV